MGIFTDPPEVPVGLGIALCKNPQALQKYASMSSDQKHAVISQTHGVNSSSDMDAFVEKIAEGQITQ